MQSSTWPLLHVYSNHLRSSTLYRSRFESWRNWRCCCLHYWEPFVQAWSSRREWDDMAPAWTTLTKLYMNYKRRWQSRRYKIVVWIDFGSTCVHFLKKEIQGIKRYIACFNIGRPEKKRNRSSEFVFCRQQDECMFKHFQYKLIRFSS